MKNRNLPAMPESISANQAGDVRTTSDVIGDAGLTKLEYAAIHIHAAKITNKNNIDPHWSLHEANRIFDELEKQDD